MGRERKTIDELLRESRARLVGFARATDVVGGFQAGRQAGLPVVPA
jgi:hypothetical protein